MVKKAKKAANKSLGFNNKNEDPALAYLPEFDAQSMLFGSMINIGWRLALTVLIPIFIGIWADNKFETKPVYTLIAFFVALVTSALVIAQMYKEINEQTSKLKFKKSTKTVKGYDDDIID